jgi:hypothetical protein
MHRFYVVAICFVAIPLVHCVMPVMPQDPSAAAAPPEVTGAGVGPSSSSNTSNAPNAAPQGKSASPMANAPAPFVPTSVEIHSDCAKTTPVFYGEKPKFGSGTKSSIGSNTTTSASRKSDGSLTVWIIDEQENGIASVHVGPTTKRVEIDRSCRQITAR